MRELILKNKPLVAATIHLREEVGMINEIATGRSADLIELRADRFYDGETRRLRQIIRDIKSAGLPVIVTVRQGEVPDLSEEKRLEIISDLLPESDAVDIELNAPICREVVETAREHSKMVIISEHDFDKTPQERELDEIFNRSLDQGADVVKIAVTPNSPGDAGKLMCFCLKSSNKNPVVCISMGEMGSFTRVYGYLFGSCFSYGFVVNPIAPGQLQIKELKAELVRFET